MEQQQITNRGKAVLDIFVKYPKKQKKERVMLVERIDDITFEIMKYIL